MPLAKKTIPVKLVSGVDTGADPILTDQALLRCQDAVFPRQGAIGKRPGQIAISGSHTELHMATYRDRPVLVDQAVKTLDGDPVTSGTFNSADTLELWKTDLDCTQTPAGEQRYNACVAEHSSVRVWAYLVPNGANYDLVIETFDRYSGRQIATDTTGSVLSTTQPRLCVCGGAIYCLAVYSGELYIASVHTSTGAITGFATTSVAMQNGAPMDACTVYDDDTGPTYGIMAAGQNVAGTHLVIAHLDVEAPAYTSTTVAVTNIDQVAVWKRQDGEGCIGYSTDGTTEVVYLTGYDSGLSNTITAGTVDTLGASVDVMNISGVCTSSSSAVLIYTEDDAALQPRIVVAVCDLPGLAAVTLTNGPRKATLASRPWIDSSQLFYWITYDQMKHAYLMGGVTHCGKALLEACEGSSTATPVATWYVSTSQDASGSGDYITALRAYVDASTKAPTMVTAARPDRLQCVEAQDCLQIPGSLPVLFDGASVVEQGYLHTPEDTFVVAASGSGSFSGLYGFAITYRWRDRFNRLHESAPYFTSVTASSDAQFDIDPIPYLTHTRRSDVQLCLWRTVAGGPTYYLLATMENDPTLDRLSGYNDSTADSAITSNEKLYTTGGVLSAQQPPQHHIQCIHDNRQLAVDSELPATRVRYPKAFETGIAIEHHPDLFIDIPPDGGDITALASYAGVLLVFKEARIYAVSGKGPTSTGAKNYFQAPYLVSEGVGCINRKTLALVPGGLVFQSSDRLVQLGRTLQPQVIGEQVRHWTDPIHGSQLDLRAAVHLPERHSVLWLTSDGVALLYDYLVEQWATWSNCETLDATEAAGLLWLRDDSADTALVEDRAAYDDDGADVTLDIQTGWLSLAGVGGYQRICMVLAHGYNITDHTLRVQAAYDNEPTWVDDQTFDSSDLTNFEAADQYGDGATDYEHQAFSLRIPLSKPKCSSVRFRFTDEDQTGTQQGFELVALTLVVGIKTGADVRGEGRRVA